MPEPDFIALEAGLLKCGIVPRDTRQLVNELRDHYDDLVDASIDTGANSREARRKAAEQLGSIEDFLAEMQARKELKSWAFRYPRARQLCNGFNAADYAVFNPVGVGVTQSPVGV